MAFVQSPKNKDQALNWSFSSGVRSTFVLPRVSNRGNHGNLCKYGVPPNIPKFLADQHAVFRVLANHARVKNLWYNEVVFFPITWITASQQRTKVNKWLPFTHHLLKEAWKYSSNWRNQLDIDLAWRSLSLQLDKKTCALDLM